MADLASGIDMLAGATASGNLAQFQEMIRQYNLTYANNVAQLYGQNWGPGQVAPIGASTLPASQMFGAQGYIPGYTGGEYGQTLNQIQGAATTAQNAGQLTGFYAPPAQSQYTPGTFVRLDPNTYDTSQYGPVQMSYVLPSGQLQRVTDPQARAMGWNGNLGTMNVIPATTAIMLERAPPTQLPQQTLQGLTTYSNLNTAAQNAALAQAQATGMYQTPAQIYAPGTDLFGHTFAQLDQGTQQAYYMSNGSDWNAAMQKWVNDSNRQITQSYQERGLPLPNQPGTPQETLQAQKQFADLYGFNPQLNAQGQVANWSTTGGYTGLSNQAPGQTLAANQQAYAQQLEAIKAAAALQANPFRQAQVMGQLGGVLGGGAVAGFQAPGQATGQSDFSGMGNMQRLIDDIRGGPGAVNSQTTDSVLNAIPTPNKLDSVNFLRASPMTQNIVLQGMQEKYGLDPGESLAQIKNTLPQFQSPTTFGGVKR